MHKLRYHQGTDARNYVVRCNCGWAASGTWRGVHDRGRVHFLQDNPLTWNDPARKYQSDREFPAYADRG